VIHDGMPHNPIHGRGHRGLKCAKWLISEAISSGNIACIINQQTNGEL